MLLSEAILLGSMLKPQGFGSPYSGEARLLSVCALEAAALAIGKAYTHIRMDMFDRCPSGPVKCSDCRRVDIITVVIVHMNDYHRLTREQIAAWVATQEALQTNNPSIEQTIESVKEEKTHEVVGSY